MATDTTPRQGILSEEMQSEREELIALLTKAYWMEIETVMSYIANSINPDGVRAQEIIESLEEDIQEELGHARQFGARIKELYGVVPGSLDFDAEQSYLQPPDEQTDIVHVIKGVIQAESGAIEHYNQIIEFTEGKDPVTQDMVIASSATRRATGACSRASCASTRPRGWPSPRPAQPARRRSNPNTALTPAPHAGPGVGDGQLDVVAGADARGRLRAAP